ncbi:MAG TPA: O-antigen ligase family protein [Thermoanaerobaculia bacterium]
MSILAVAFAITLNLQDRFILIKESVFRVEALLLLVLVVAAIAFGGTGRVRAMLGNRAMIGLLAGAVLWTAVATLFSSERSLSGESLLTVVLSAILVFAIWYAAPWMSLWILDAVAVAAVVNAIMTAGQQFGWIATFPAGPEALEHLLITALIGNPNVVGSYLALATVLLAFAALQLRGLRRWLYAVAATVAAAGMFVSQTKTAMIVLAVALFIAALMHSRRTAAILVGIVVLVLAAGAVMRVPVVTTLLSLPSYALQGRWDMVTSSRLTPSLVAFEMFRDDPLTGMGPGTFKHHYFFYRLRVVGSYSPRLTVGAPEMFGETHNDHLQMLAEGGLPAWLLMLAALYALVRPRSAFAADDARGRIARAWSVPFATAVFVLCLAQFPLQIAITRHLILTFSALIVGWREAR